MSDRARAGVRRRVLGLPLFGLTLGALVSGGVAVSRAAAGPVLPTGGRVVAGSASIGTPGGGSLTVRQSSAKAIIDWAGFSIGKGGAVSFQNGAGATLNRVTGQAVSSLDGLLSATGSVYLLNPNGVIVGRSGVVNVGGTFVASTLDTTDASFLAGGPLGFSGPSTAAVVNYGRIGALGGDVALVASRVSNAGTITAPKGDAGLLAGSSVVLRDASLDEGRFSVLVGGAGVSATNSGLISAANAELRAEGGNVYALAGDTAGVIRATGVSTGGGHVWLVADGGQLSLAGVLEAQAAGGAPGAVETSGRDVSLGSARVDAHGGTWLIDPVDLTIDQIAATTIDGALNAGTSVVEQTTASGYSGSGVANYNGKGDITVAAPLTWNTSAALTLSAYRNVELDAPITVSGGGALTLVTDNAQTGGGGSLVIASPVRFTSADAVGQPTGSLSIGQGRGAPVSYQLVSSLAQLSAAIASNNSGFYALATDVDGSNGGQGYSATPVSPSTPFAGVLEGLDNSIVNLTISNTSSTYVGLFGQLSSTAAVMDLRLSGSIMNTFTGSTYIGGVAGQSAGVISHVTSLVSVGSGQDVGGVVGDNSGVVDHSFAAGEVSGGDAGGLVGDNFGSVTNSYATAKVAGGMAADSGGLVGFNNGVIANSYASGAVDHGTAGGLAGFNNGLIRNSYATGPVAADADAGGLVGEDQGSVSASYASGRVTGGLNVGGLIGEIINAGSAFNSYYDVGTTGQTVGIGAVGRNNSGVSNITGVGSDGPSAYAASSYANLDLSASGPWVILDGDTRPMLRMEASTSISNAHQLQLMATSPAATYRLIADIDASGTTNPSDVWSAAGFAPVGNESTPFTGSLAGGGHSVTGLIINRPTSDQVGLFGDLAGQVSQTTVSGSVRGRDAVGLVAGYASGGISAASGKGSVAGESQVGAIAGYASGSVHGSLGKASVSGLDAAAQQLGGLVGASQGSLISDSASGAVSGNMQVGGLVGLSKGVVDHSYASGAVSGVSGKTAAGAGTAVGGLVGENDGQVSASYASGSVSGYHQVGGLVGYQGVEGFSSEDHASGAVSAKSGAGTPAGAGSSAGGLIGENDSRYGVFQVYATGAVTGASQVGGLIGLNSADGAVQQSYATGAVKGGSAVGGFVGENKSRINDDYATGAVSGSSGNAGFVGQNDASGQIATSYATGSGGAGFAGSNMGQFSSDVFDSGSAGTATGVASGSSTGLTTIGGSTGLDPFQMSSYAGFDFQHVWKINPGSSRPFITFYDVPPAN